MAHLDMPRFTHEASGSLPEVVGDPAPGFFRVIDDDSGSASSGLVAADFGLGCGPADHLQLFDLAVGVSDRDLLSSAIDVGHQSFGGLQFLTITKIDFVG